MQNYGQVSGQHHSFHLIYLHVHEGLDRKRGDVMGYLVQLRPFEILIKKLQIFRNDKKPLR